MFYLPVLCNGIAKSYPKPLFWGPSPVFWLLLSLCTPIACHLLCGHTYILAPWMCVSMELHSIDTRTEGFSPTLRFLLTACD